jgi:hypothetical protein
MDGNRAQLRKWLNAYCSGLALLKQNFKSHGGRHDDHSFRSIIGC